MSSPQHEYQLIRGSDPGRPLLILLHGSGGNETDMVPLVAKFSPQSTAVAVRGAIPWDDGYAFFRRHEDRSVDEDNLLAQASILADFIVGVSARHGHSDPPILVGFSNGAIMAAALVLLYPELTAGAALLRPLPPFAEPVPSQLPDTPILIIDGSHDERRKADDGRRLAEHLIRAGADVAHHQLGTGHAPTDADHRLIRKWLNTNF
jgi:phospholipase/carboxylesterase